LSTHLVNSWGEFTQKFGAIQAANEYLGHAVRILQQRRHALPQRAADPKDTHAINQFQSIDEIAMVAAPLAPDTAAKALNDVQAKLVTHCQLMEDRVAILDSVRDIKDDNLVVTPDEKGIWRPAANPKGYGAFYFPWIEVADLAQTRPGHPHRRSAQRTPSSGVTPAATPSAGCIKRRQRSRSGRPDVLPL
jgi:hypothetical protein